MLIYFYFILLYFWKTRSIDLDLLNKFEEPFFELPMSKNADRIFHLSSLKL